MIFFIKINYCIRHCILCNQIKKNSFIGL